MGKKKLISEIVADLKVDFEVNKARFEKECDGVEDKAEAINALRELFVKDILRIIRGAEFYSDDPMRDLVESIFLEIFPGDLIDLEDGFVVLHGNYYSSSVGDITALILQYTIDDLLQFFVGDEQVELIAYLRSRNYHPDEEMGTYEKPLHVEDLDQELYSFRDFIASQSLKRPISDKKKKRKKKS